MDEGSTITLTTDFPANQTVTWRSENNAVATVNQNGVVTGVKAGKTNITATCAEAAVPVTFTVYVTVADGVYYIKNAASGLCLANKDVTVNSTAIHIERKNTSSVTDPTQFWRITYKDRPSIVSNKTICAGCRALIEEYIEDNIEN